MEKRKLQATGGTSLTLTLPKAWTNQVGLQSKDEVTVASNGQSLVVKPAVRSKHGITIELPIEKAPNAWITREIIAAFIYGADKVSLYSSRITPSQNQAIRQTIQLLFGFEILEETSQTITARSVVDDTKFPVSESTLRIFVMASDMFQDALHAAQTGDIELANDITMRDYEVNKFLYAIKRQFQEILSGKVDGELASVNYYHSVAIQLERIADHAVKIAELASSNRTDFVKLSTTFPAIQFGVRQSLKDVEAMVRQLDKVQAHKFLDGDQDLEQLLYGSKHMKQSYEGALIEASLDRLRGYLMNIAELTIDYTLTQA